MPGCGLGGHDGPRRAGHLALLKASESLVKGRVRVRQWAWRRCLRLGRPAPHHSRDRRSARTAAMNAMTRTAASPVAWSAEDRGVGVGTDHGGEREHRVLDGVETLLDRADGRGFGRCRHPWASSGSAADRDAPVAALVAAAGSFL